MTRIRVMLVEPYHGGSHRAWAEGYRTHSRHQVTLITHDARFWKWRMHGAHITLADAIDVEVAGTGPPDVILASSMVNLASLLGAARRSIGSAPAVLFMHENQLTYPLSPRDRPDDTYAMVNWTSMAVAERVVFNSEFHRAAWFEAVPRLLRAMPDYRHLDRIDAVAAASVVLPVGVDLARIDAARLDAARPAPAAVDGRRPLVLWNQRGEHDKGPDEFVAAVRSVARRGVDFGVALAGERFVSPPESFEVLRRDLPDRIVHDEYAADGDYVDLLLRSDVVVSTAHQEFFGIAVTEAVYAGAFPLLPDRVVYPERLPARVHARCLHHDADDLADKLEWALTRRTEARQVAASLRPEMAHFDWSEVAARYDDLLEAVAEG